MIERNWNRPTYLNKYSFPVECWDTKEVCNNYQEYLRSEHWQRFRAKFYASKPNTVCRCCNAKTSLDLHHTTYKHLGHEWLKDIIPLCRECHGLTHKVAKEMLAENPDKPWDVLKKKSWQKVRLIKVGGVKTKEDKTEKQIAFDKRREERRQKRLDRKINKDKSLNGKRCKKYKYSANKWIDERIKELEAQSRVERNKD